jgi:hypothetical protein
MSATPRAADESSAGFGAGSGEADGKWLRVALPNGTASGSVTPRLVESLARPGGNITGMSQINHRRKQSPIPFSPSIGWAPSETERATYPVHVVHLPYLFHCARLCTHVSTHCFSLPST